MNGPRTTWQRLTLDANAHRPAPSRREIGPPKSRPDCENFWTRCEQMRIRLRKFRPIGDYAARIPKNSHCRSCGDEAGIVKHFLARARLWTLVKWFFEDLKGISTCLGPDTFSSWARMTVIFQNRDNYVIKLYGADEWKESEKKNERLCEKADAVNDAK